MGIRLPPPPPASWGVGRILGSREPINPLQTLRNARVVCIDWVSGWLGGWLRGIKQAPRPAGGGRTPLGPGVSKMMHAWVCQRPPPPYGYAKPWSERCREGGGLQPDHCNGMKMQVCCGRVRTRRDPGHRVVPCGRPHMEGIRGDQQGQRGPTACLWVPAGASHLPEP